MIPENLHVNPADWKGIDFAWLKQTPLGSTGIIPKTGFRYEHHAPTPMAVEHIVVVFDRYDLKLIRNPNLKSGWTRPDAVCK